MSNILAKSELALGDAVDEALLQEEAEKGLFAAMQASSQQVEPLFAKRDYTEGLKTLAVLRTPVDRFFDEVMVNADDEALKKNRLTLLSQLQALFLEVADISLLVPAKK